VARPAIPEASRRRLDDTVERLRALVPDDWTVTVAHRQPDLGMVTISAYDGTEATVSVVTRDRLEPREIDRLLLPEGPTIVSAKWLSARSRELLRDLQIGFLDQTGNVEVRLRRPALYVRATGSSNDPNPKPVGGPTLRGPRVWALMRTLIEVTPPYTAGDLSSALGIDDGYVSRVLQTLANERLISRRPRGPVTEVQWEPLLRQLATTYSLFDANETSTWIAAAGPDQMLRDAIAAKARRWAVTGSFVASSIAPAAAPEVAVVFTDDPERFAKTTRLLPTTIGANVILAKPYDPIVFQRGWPNADFPSVSVAQLAIDLLTGNARMPAEGRSLIDWMRRDPSRWQTASLRWTGRQRVGALIEDAGLPY
jgi:hypothetical protein